MLKNGRPYTVENGSEDKALISDLASADIKRVDMWIQAHRHGMRISRVCAWGTSKYAFDGSGEVLRGKDAGFKTYSLCRFRNGKVYNCDLSAAKNIGARYFLREYAKLEGCPKLPCTPQRTYSTLYGLVNALKEKAKAS